MEAAAGIRLVIFTIYILICTVSDLRTRSIDFYLSLGTSVIGAVLMVYTGEGPMAVITGALPGIFLMFLSLVSRGGVGMGDGLFSLTAGIYLGMRGVLIAIIISWMLAALIGLARVVAGAPMRDKSGIPLVSVMGVVIIIMKVGQIYG